MITLRLEATMRDVAVEIVPGNSQTELSLHRDGLHISIVQTERIPAACERNEEPILVWRVSCEMALDELNGWSVEMVSALKDKVDSLVDTSKLHSRLNNEQYLISLDRTNISFSDQLSRSEQTMKDAIERAIALIYWRSRVMEPAEQPTNWRLYAIGNVDRDPIFLGRPNFGSLRFFSSWGGELDEGGASDVKSFYEAGRVTPLAQVLVRETWLLENVSKRAAIVIAASAVEISLKRFIIIAASQTEYLIENMQSPSIERLAEDYMPLLLHEPQANAYRAVYKKHFKAPIEKTVRLRNLIVHRTDTSPKQATIIGFVSGEESFELLKSMTDFVYLIDYLSGVDWAIQHLSEAVRDSLLQSLKGHSV